MDSIKAGVLVLGVGNILCSDDGLGVYMANHLSKKCRFPPEVSIYDGGTLGMPLIMLFEQAAVVIIIDAIKAKAKPGTIHRLLPEDFAMTIADKQSMHQLTLKEIMTCARMLDINPKVVFLGIEPQDISFGVVALSKPVKKALPFLKKKICDEINQNIGYAPTIS